MKSQRSGRQGFAIVEVLVAALIFGLGALALTRLHGALLRHAEAARQRSEATLLAQSRLDELQATLAWLPAGAAWPIEAGSAQGAAAVGHDAPQSPTTAFDRRWRVSSIEGEPGLRRIDMHVSWTDRDGRSEPGITLTRLLPVRDPEHVRRAARSAPATH